ncbi:MAG: peptidylprolyl isomerase [Terriglobia bacterium]|jgi:parvulin-like peptidyl-prolyl isomerase
MANGIARLVAPVTAFLLSAASVVSACPQAPVVPSAIDKSAVSERVVISIGDEKITDRDFEQLIAAMPPEYRKFYSGPGKHLLPQYIIRLKILSAQAVKEGLANHPDVVRAIEISRESVLTGAEQKHIEEGITVNDQELRDRYEKNKESFEEVRVSHILIRTENATFKPDDPSHPGLPDADARKKLEEIRKQILAGADFAEMAKKYSEDAATVASGGDMGVIRPDRVVPPIIEAAHSLSPGQVSDLITTPYGVEIIKVEQKRTIPFEEAKPSLESQVRQSKASAVIQQIEDEYHVVIDKEFFGEPAANQNPAAPPRSP